jgi:hypothetical protein
MAAWLSRHPGNWHVGRATVFGLPYNGERDLENDGRGAFGQRADNKTLQGFHLRLRP